MGYPGFGNASWMTCKEEEYFFGQEDIYTLYHIFSRVLLEHGMKLWVHFCFVFFFFFLENDKKRSYVLVGNWKLIFFPLWLNTVITRDL